MSRRAGAAVVLHLEDKRPTYPVSSGEKRLSAIKRKNPIYNSSSTLSSIGVPASEANNMLLTSHLPHSCLFSPIPI